MPVWLQAGFWGLVSGSALLVGAAVGYLAKLPQRLIAGIMAFDSSGVRIEDGMIQGTRTGTLVYDLDRSIDVGDGIHLIGTHDDVQISNVTLAGNERAGLVVDLGPAGTGSITFRDVTASSSAALGAVAGRLDASRQLVPVPLGGWDDGITRTGDAPTLDAMRATMMTSLQAVEAAAPPNTPDPVRAGGFIAPCD